MATAPKKLMAAQPHLPKYASPAPTISKLNRKASQGFFTMASRTECRCGGACATAFGREVERSALSFFRGDESPRFHLVRSHIFARMPFAPQDKNPRASTLRALVCSRGPFAPQGKNPRASASSSGWKRGPSGPRNSVQRIHGFSHGGTGSVCAPGCAEE